jgi:hypothetical protein
MAAVRTGHQPVTNLAHDRGIKDRDCFRVSSSRTVRSVQSANSPLRSVTKAPGPRSLPGLGGASWLSATSRMAAGSNSMVTPRYGSLGLASATRPNAGISMLSTAPGTGLRLNRQRDEASNANPSTCNRRHRLKGSEAFR